MGALIDGLLSRALLSRELQRQVQLAIQDGLHTRGDRLLLTAGLQNLPGNARTFTGRGGAAVIDSDCPWWLIFRGRVTV